MNSPAPEVMLRTVTLLLCLPLLLLGCATQEKPHSTAMHNLVRNGDEQIHLSLQPVSQNGQTSVLIFSVTRGGAPLDMEKEGLMLHVILSSADYRDFLHTYTLETVSPGTYSVTHSFTRRGGYRVWAELDDPTGDGRHGEHALLIAYVDISAGGPEVPSAELNRSTTATSVEGVTASLAVPSPLVSGSTGALQLTAADAAGSLTFPEGEAALYVIVGPGQTLIWHGHADNHDGRSITLRHFFPAPGEYLLWTQLFPKDADGKYHVTEASFAFAVETRTEE